jgi:hypothetical protein
MLCLLLVCDGFSGQSCANPHDCPDMMQCIEDTTIPRGLLTNLPLLFDAEHSHDVLCQLVEGLFPTAACT